LLLDNLRLFLCNEAVDVPEIIVSCLFGKLDEAGDTFSLEDGVVQLDEL